jgi:hypothetical protein
MIIPLSRLKREPCVNHGLTGNCKLGEWLPQSTIHNADSLNHCPAENGMGRYSAIQQARRPAVSGMFATFPIRYRQLIDASALF